MCDHPCFRVPLNRRHVGTPDPIPSFPSRWRGFQCPPLFIISFPRSSEKRGRGIPLGFGGNSPVHLPIYLQSRSLPLSSKGAGGRHGNALTPWRSPFLRGEESIFPIHNGRGERSSWQPRSTDWLRAPLLWRRAGRDFVAMETSQHPGGDRTLNDRSE